MNSGISVCIVGAGSSYTPELVEGLIARPRAALPITRIALTDTDPERLSIMAGFADRAVRHAGRDIAVTSDARLAPMLEGADFVITQIRVGGMRARHLDESIPLKYGIIGQETTGPGGMCKALRTIPPMLDIARAVAAVCPDAFVLNYSNPSGIVTEAVTKYTRARIIGLCAGIPSIQRRIEQKLAHRFPDLKSYAVGLNHFGHIHRLVSHDVDVTRNAIACLEEENERSAAGVGTGLMQTLQAIPIGYVNYFYHRGKAVSEATARPETRAKEIEQIERAILAEAADPKIVTKPESLSQRGGGGYAEITFAVMQAIVNDTGEELTVNVPNRGSVDGIDDGAVVEIVCRIDKLGAHPLPVGPIPLAFRGVMQALKTYETLTVEAAVHTDRRFATLALLNHPLVGDLDVIEPMLDEMLEAHGLQLS